MATCWTSSGMSADLIVACRVIAHRRQRRVRRRSGIGITVGVADFGSSFIASASRFELSQSRRGSSSGETDEPVERQIGQC